MASVNHKYLKENSIESRVYQETILNTAVNQNTLVVLPTGLGKTYIAALLAAKRLEENPGRILFLAPTKPLVEQHYSTWKNIFKFNEDEFGVFTGMINPEKRETLYNDVNFIFATPQVINNDIISGKIDLQDVVLLIVDEAHRAAGDYPYGFIAKKYVEISENPRVLALTASPGSTKERVQELCKELYIEAVEARDRYDRDVAPYVKERTFNWISVELPREFRRIKSLLESVLKEYTSFLKKAGFLQSSSIQDLRKKQVLELQGKLARMAPHNKDVYPYVSANAAVLKLYHSLELLETQGIAPLHEYFKKLGKDRSKAAHNLLRDSQFKAALALTEELRESKTEHPKMEKLLSFLNKKDKVIVFAHYRASVDSIMKELKNKGIKATKLIGHAPGTSGSGLSQKEQVTELDKFRKGRTNVLVTTSVGEEGLDIPAVDHVIFYEPVPSAIRSIQRQGRTARHRPGKVSILVTKGTRDEGYYWSARRKEEKMKTSLRDLIFKPKKQGTLDKYSAKEEQRIVVFADTRESGSGVLKELSELGVDVRIKHLNVADFQLSSRVGIERKTAEDFLQSLIDGRLLSQVRQLSSVFENPVIVVEGGSLYGLRDIHPNAIRGSLAALAVDFRIPIIYSEDVKDTAGFLAVLAKREQLDLKKEIQLRTAVKPKDTAEAQQFIVESLPSVGPTLAKKLLKKFKSVEKVINASESELQQIPKLGEKKAKEIRKVVSSKYKES